MEINTWDAGAAAIKAAVYAATLCAAGGVFFLSYCAPLISVEQRGRICRWIGLCVATAVITSVVRISILAGSMGEGLPGAADGAMVRMVLQAGEGRATGVRVAALLLTGATCFIQGRWAVLSLCGALLAAGSFAWVGHSWGHHHGGLLILTLSLHLMGVTFWLGALMPLLLIARDGDRLCTARTAARFGDAAVIVVPMLILAGTIEACGLLTRVSDLWTTPYGRAVMIKLGLVACLLSLAALNKLRLVPRLWVHDSNAVQQLSRSIRREMMLGTLILIATAVLTTLLGPPVLE